MITAGKIQVSSDIKKVYEYLEQAVLDGLIPIYRPIAFRLNNGVDTQHTNINRNFQCLESMLAIAGRLQTILFKDLESLIVKTNPVKGKFTTDMDFKCRGQKISCITKGYYLFTTMDIVELILLCDKCTGFVSMGENADKTFKYLKDNTRAGTYFPVSSYHNLSNDFHILPLDETKNYIEYRTSNIGILDIITDDLRNQGIIFNEEH